MDNQAQTISSSAMLSEAAHRMKLLEVDRLAVVENNEVIGTITDCDVAGAAAASLNLTTTPVKYAMTLDAAQSRPAEVLANTAGTGEDG